MSTVLEAPSENIEAPQGNGQAPAPAEAPRNRGGRPKGAVTERTTEEVLAGKIEAVVKYAIESGFSLDTVSTYAQREFQEYDAKKAKSDFNKLVSEKLSTATPDQIKAMIAQLQGA